MRRNKDDIVNNNSLKMAQFWLMIIEGVGLHSEAYCIRDRLQILRKDRSQRTLCWEGKFSFKIQFHGMARVVLILTHNVVASQRRTLFQTTITRYGII